MVTAFGFAIITNRVEDVTLAVINSAGSATELCICLLGTMAIWTGIMKVAQKAGLIELISKAVSPLMRLIFPDIPKSHPAIGAMVMNMVANFLGLGNAATPFGISAMEHLQTLNKSKKAASHAMITFLVLNTSAIQLIPSTIIAVRTATGSSNPTEIIPSIWGSTLCAAISAIIITKVFSAYNKRHI